jgi:hypothetical protein
MSDHDKQKEVAEQRSKALVEMGLEDPEDWELENPFDYMPYQVNHPKGSA